MKKAKKFIVELEAKTSHFGNTFFPANFMAGTVCN